MPEEQNPTDLKQKLSSILDWVEETAKSAEQFAIEQTPLYIQELLAWNFWVTLPLFILGLVVWAITISRIKFVASYNYDKDPEPASAVLSVGALILGPIIGSALIGANLDWFQIWIAPRVWLVEFVASKL